MNKEFDIIYEFKPKGETYAIIFFIDGDNIYKTNINHSVLLRIIKTTGDYDDKLQAYLRKAL